MTKNNLFLSLLCLLFITTQTKAQEAYAVYDDGTLSFYYDNQKDSRDGTTYYLNAGSNIPRWTEHKGDITRVVFDESFSQVSPTSTYTWFCEMTNLKFIEGLRYLNTSEVTNMDWMFRDCNSLTSLDVSNFNTANVTTMLCMFCNCENLTNLDLSNFNTANVTNMDWMFTGCRSLTSLDLSNFNTANVTTMICMFNDCASLTSLDVSNFNTAKVTNMRNMFENCTNLTSLDVSNFNIENVTSMSDMFSGCSGLTSLDLSNFNTKNVTSMYGMFSGCSGLTSLDVSNFNTEKLTNMGLMFAQCRSLTSLDVSNFNTENVTSMYNMFSGCSGLTSLDLSNFNTSNVKNMYCMFSRCSGLTSLDLSNFNTENVTNMGSMFYNCTSLTSLDLSNFNTLNATNMEHMFKDCTQLGTIFCSERWYIEKVGKSDDMFLNCYKLKGQMGTAYDSEHLDKVYARIDGGTSSPGYLTYKPFVGDCSFSDVPSSNAFYDATCYLYSLGVVSGVDDSGKMELDAQLLRSHLAKIAFRGVYSIKMRTVPETVPSDNFPTVYNDLREHSEINDYYYQAARSLLYLEYGDGVTAFDRNRLAFDPEGTIARAHVLKVLMEAFNIQPDLQATDNPFPDDANVVKLATNQPRLMGYIRKAVQLGIITTTNKEFRPYAYCTRGEAFMMLYRIMKNVDNGKIDDPNPQESDYFQPLNTTLKTISLGAGLTMGNFQHYTKTSFAMEGVMPIVFSHSYNSYNTTLPDVFFGDKGTNKEDNTYQPLGDGWSHTYHSFATVVGDLTKNDTRLVVHWGGGSIDVYKSDGRNLVPESMGVYDQCEVVDGELVITTKSQVKYHFAPQQGSNAQIMYLKNITDRNNNQMTISYENGIDGNYRISSVSDGYRSLIFTYLDGTDYLEKVSDPLGREIKFAYFDNQQTGKKQLQSFTDAENNTTTYEYADLAKVGTSKLLSRIQLPKGNYIENEYDANRRLSKTVSGKNGVPATQTNVTVSADYTNDSPSIGSKVEVLRQGTTSTYNYSYNENNSMKEMTGPENLNVKMDYQGDHPELPTFIQNNNTTISDVQYDTRGNITSITVDGDGSLTTKIVYNTRNDIVSITDPNKNETTFTYDNDKGNLTQIDEPEGVTTKIEIGEKGLPTEITNATGVVTRYEYNDFGNVETVKLPALGLYTTSVYDDASRLTKFTDALQRETKFEYDANDNLKKETDAKNHSTIYNYDENDNLTSITNAKGGVTTLTYDNATDWLTSVEFGGFTKRYSYNKDCSLATFTKPDNTTFNYSYDELGRITSDGVNSYTYDNKFRLRSVSDGSKTLTFDYDGFNRITGTTFGGHSNSYEYDDNGNCTNINGTTYEYDGLNRMVKVKFNGKTIYYDYRKDSQLDKVRYPNGMTTIFGYDVVGRLTSKTTRLSNGAVIAGYSYTLDNVGNITEQTAQEPYTDIVLPDENTTYSYNNVNRITKAGDTTFSFDRNGNTTSRGNESYTWDVQDRLTNADGTAINYDPLGLIASYGDITFTTDPLGMGNVLSDTRSGAQYIYGNGLEARVKNGSVSYYVTDFRGSVVAIVDENGNITHKYQYDEFGNVVQKEEADYNPFQYVGKYGVMYLTDHLYYMRARHYDPTIGRFLSEDPIWSTNLYPYADNNPIMGIDPRGLYTKEYIEDVRNGAHEICRKHNSGKNLENCYNYVDTNIANRYGDPTNNIQELPEFNITPEVDDDMIEDHHSAIEMLKESVTTNLNQKVQNNTDNYGSPNFSFWGTLKMLKKYDPHFRDKYPIHP